MDHVSQNVNSFCARLAQTHCCTYINGCNILNRLLTGGTSPICEVELQHIMEKNKRPENKHEGHKRLQSYNIQMRL